MADSTPGAELCKIIATKLRLVDGQVACGMDRQGLLDHQSVQIIGLLSERPPLPEACGTMVSELIAKGPWSDQNKVALGSAIMDSVNKVKGVKKSRRDGQYMDGLLSYLTEHDWGVLNDPQWGLAVKQQTIAMRLNQLGVTCPSEDLSKRGGALALVTSFGMDSPMVASATERHNSSHRIYDLVKCYDSSMASWPFQHICTYPPQPSMLGEPIFKHCYRNGPPSSAAPSQQLVQNYETLVPRMIYRSSHVELKKDKGIDTAQGARRSDDGDRMQQAINALSQATQRLGGHYTPSEYGMQGGHHPGYPGGPHLHHGFAPKAHGAVPSYMLPKMQDVYNGVPPKFPPVPGVHCAHEDPPGHPDPRAHAKVPDWHCPHKPLHDITGAPWLHPARAHLPPGFPLPEAGHPGAQEVPGEPDHCHLGLQGGDGPLGKGIAFPGKAPGVPPRFVPKVLGTTSDHPVDESPDSAAALDALTAKSAGAVAKAAVGSAVGDAIAAGRGGKRGRGRGSGRGGAKSKPKGAARPKAVMAKPAAADPKAAGSPGAQTAKIGPRPQPTEHSKHHMLACCSFGGLDVFAAPGDQTRKNLFSTLAPNTRTKHIGAASILRIPSPSKGLCGSSTTPTA